MQNVLVFIQNTGIGTCNFMVVCARARACASVCVKMFVSFCTLPDIIILLSFGVQSVLNATKSEVRETLYYKIVPLHTNFRMHTFKFAKFLSLVKTVVKQMYQLKVKYEHNKNIPLFLATTNSVLQNLLLFVSCATHMTNRDKL